MDSADNFRDFKIKEDGIEVNVMQESALRGSAGYVTITGPNGLEIHLEAKVCSGQGADGRGYPVVCFRQLKD